MFSQMLRVPTLLALSIILVAWNAQPVKSAKGKSNALEQLKGNLEASLERK